MLLSDGQRYFGRTSGSSLILLLIALLVMVSVTAERHLDFHYQLALLNCSHMSMLDKRVLR